jgi:hypothetical protein
LATSSKQIYSRRPRAEVLGAVVGNLVGPLRGMGYHLESQSDQGVVFRWTSFRSGVFQSRPQVTMSFSDGPDGGTYITVAGTGPHRVAKQFNELELDNPA